MSTFADQAAWTLLAGLLLATATQSCAGNLEATEGDNSATRCIPVEGTAGMGFSTPEAAVRGHHEMNLRGHGKAATAKNYPGRLARFKETFAVKESVKIGAARLLFYAYEEPDTGPVQRVARIEPRHTTRWFPVTSEVGSSGGPSGLLKLDAMRSNGSMPSGKPLWRQACEHFLAVTRPDLAGQGQDKAPQDSLPTEFPVPKAEECVNSFSQAPEPKSADMLAICFMGCSTKEEANDCFEWVEEVEKKRKKSAAEEKQTSQAPAPEPTVPPSELVVEDIKEGTGATPRDGQKATVHYNAFLLDGTKFDSSVDRGIPFVFKVGAKQVIEGFDIGVKTMKVGGKRKVTIPPHLGYGSKGAGGVIPPNATLIFVIELLLLE